MPHRGPRQALLDGMDAEEYVDNFIIDVIPAVFGTDFHGYHAWRRDVSRLLDVDPAALHVVGSACTGFSLDPRAALRLFSAKSDVDVAVVSAHHFDVAWRMLRRSQPSWLSWPDDVRHSVKLFAASDVYFGCIATDKILAVLPFAHDWFRGRDVASQHPSILRRVEFRLYRDLDGLRDYHVRNVRRLQSALDEGAV